MHTPAPHLEEVLDPLWVVAVALPADPLHLLDLARLAGSLDVLEVDIWVLTEVNHTTKEEVQACRMGGEGGRGGVTGEGEEEKQQILVTGTSGTIGQLEHNRRWPAASTTST